MSTSQATGFFGRTPSRVVSTVVGGRVGGANSSLDGQGEQPQPGLSTKIIDMLNEQKQLINSVIKTQKELEQTVDVIKSEVAEVKKDMSGLSVSLEDISHNSTSGTTNKTNKLPKPVTSAVKKLHQQLENQFNPSKLLHDEYNQGVSLELQTKLKHEFEEQYPERTIKRAVSRHYESRRREYLDAQPNREAAKETNIKNTKVRSRKRQLYQRRLRQCKSTEERKIFQQIDEAYMTEESDSPDGNSFLQHQPVWRSDKLNKVIKILDKRGNSVTQQRFKKPRVLSSPLKSSVPLNAPSWAISTQQISSDSTDLEVETSSTPEVETSSTSVETSILHSTGEQDSSEFQEFETRQDSPVFSQIVDQIMNEDLEIATPTLTSKQVRVVSENTFSTPPYSTSEKNSGSVSTSKRPRKAKQIFASTTPSRQKKKSAQKRCPLFAFEDDDTSESED